MTESPTAVTWPPGTRGCSRWHAAGVGVGVGVALAGARPAVGELDEAEGAAGVDWEALLTRSPLATCRSSPLGAAGAGVRATP